MKFIGIRVKYFVLQSFLPKILRIIYTLLATASKYHSSCVCFMRRNKTETHSDAPNSSHILLLTCSLSEQQPTGAETN
jgi:hypothetical protein